MRPLHLLLAALLAVPTVASAGPYPGHPHGRPDPYHRPPLPSQVRPPPPRTSHPVRPHHHQPQGRGGWIDRHGAFAVGIRTGGLVGGWRDVEEEAVYGDFGLGANLRWRPVAPLGLEVAVTHYDQAWRPGTQRAQTMGQTSVMGFFAPRRVLQPYVLGGLTITGARFDDDVVIDGRRDRVEAHGILLGPHLGAGLEIALGPRFALDFDLRGVGYVNVPREGRAFPLQLQSTAGVLVHF